MDKRCVIWLAPGVVAFTLALAGCQKKEEPVPAANPAPAAAPAASAPSDAGSVSPGQAGGNTSTGSSAPTGETKTPDNQETGKKTF